MDKTFTKQLKKFVENDNLSLNISVQDRQLVVSGSKSLVDIFAENPEFGKQLYDRILLKESDQKDCIFETYKPGVLPKLTANMFDKKAWTGGIPRQNLQTYMLCLGFGRGGGKCYQTESDKPDGWPDSIALEHPSYMKKEDIKTVIEALLTHRNIDPKTYFTVSAQQPKVTNKRRKKTPISVETVDEEAEDGQDGNDGGAVNGDQPDLAPNIQHDVGGHNNNAGANENNENNNANIENVEIQANQNQQHQQPTLDPSGHWYWDYYQSQWFPYYPPQAEQEHINYHY